MGKKKKLTEEEKDAFAAELKREQSKQKVSDRLTQLNFGGGQDSTAILWKMLFHKKFRKHWAPNDLLVVMSDTGNEHPQTYHNAKLSAELCLKHNVTMRIVTADVERLARSMNVDVATAYKLGAVEGFHTEAWPTLTEHWRRIGMVGSQAFDKSCTSNLKLQPIYRHLENFLGERYGLEAAKRGASGRWTAKKAIPAFAKKYGRIRVLLGIARSEESRVKKAPEPQRWMEESMAKRYPLIEMGWGRQECQNYMLEWGDYMPLPSNCMFCPFLSPIELLWLHRTMPDRFDEWVEIEAAKLAKYDGVISKKTGEPIKNQGVFPDKGTLRDVLAAAQEKFGHMSDCELNDYKMSHGHCVQSKY